jgi:hypothetical protein
MPSLAAAREHHEAGRYDDAVRELTALLQERPSDTEIRMQLAASQLAKASLERSPPRSAAINRSRLVASGAGKW